MWRFSRASRTPAIGSAFAALLAGLEPLPRSLADQPPLMVRKDDEDANHHLRHRIVRIEVAARHVTQMNADLQLGPRVEDLSESDERAAQTVVSLQ